MPAPDNPAWTEDQRRNLKTVYQHPDSDSTTVLVGNPHPLVDSALVDVIEGPAPQ